MIKQIKINNFQSHANTELLFHEGVNVLVGGSDSGKTSILRALNWIVNNKPSGDSFRSRWGGDTSVEIEKEGDILQRIKTKGNNKYILNGKELNAVGVHVPEEVEKILNFSDINMQFQTDTSFLLSNTSGEVARYLNQIVNLDKIDVSLSNIEKRKRKNNNEISRLSVEIKDTEDEIEQYSYIDDEDKKIEKVEERYNNFLSLERKQKSLYDLYNNFCAIKTELNKFKKIDVYHKKVNELLLVLDIVKKEKNYFSSLFDFVNSIKNMQEKEIILNKKTKKEKQIDDCLIEIKNIKEKQNKRDMLLQVFDTQKEIINLEKEIKKKEKELKNIFPDRCTLCGQLIKKEDIKI